MNRTAIEPVRLCLANCRAWSDDWFLLACGDFAAGSYNAMTVAWGGLGVMWNRPIAMVVVRPTRYTYEFMERYPDFTLCRFPVDHRDALQYCGSHSGRDGDKIAAARLTATAARRVGSPVFDEAELAVECRIIYSQDFDPGRFKDPAIERNYPLKDYHRMYFGEILHVEGAGDFTAG